MISRKANCALALKIVSLALTLAAALFVVAIGLGHISALVEAAIALAILGFIVRRLCREKKMHTPLRVGCISFALLLPWVVYHTYPYFTDSRPVDTRVIDIPRGRTRIIATPYTLVTSWQVLSASVGRPAVYKLTLLSRDEKSEIIMRVYRAPEVVSVSDQRKKVESVAVQARPGAKPFTEVHFHSLFALKRSQNVTGSFDFPYLTAVAPVTEDLTIVAWKGYYMLLITGHPAGNLVARQSIDRELATFVPCE